MFERRAEVVTIGGLSAHDGQNFLMQFARSSQGKLKRIFLVHGEPKGAEPLRALIDQERLAPVTYPDYLDSVEI